ncbi:hypothetical protein NCS52_00885000 [Fusarium sp. LHS14.1]|nr:hypothetical protein NCS52_00885000 [Fusarium sp. LHS14.1]
MATYQITIKNNSGSQQNYFIFNEAPKINNAVSSDVWLNVFQRKATAKGQTCVFKFASNYGAVVGSADSDLSAGSSVSVGNPIPVQLGVANDDGTLRNKGTSLQMTVIDGAPQFTENPPTANGAIQAFEIVTDSSFTFAEAKNNNYLIGLGGDLQGTGLSGPAATFVPQPGKSYQIQPVKKFWVATGDYQRGALIKVASVNTTIVPIDFSTRDSVNATVVHNDVGKMTLQVN